MTTLTHNDGYACYVFKMMPELTVSKTKDAVFLCKGTKTMSVPRGVSKVTGNVKFFVDGKDCNQDKELATLTLNQLIALAQGFFGSE